MKYQWLVFPTYVGVNRDMICADAMHASIPHVCGGEPTYALKAGIVKEYSPRMWG